MYSVQIKTKYDFRTSLNFFIIILKNPAKIIATAVFNSGGNWL